MTTPWATPPEAVLRVLDTSIERGLSEREARLRLGRFGPNRLRQTRRRSNWGILWDQFESLIVALLAAAAVIAFAFDEVVEGFAIIGVIIINAGIGFVTESRAVRSMEALRELGRTESTVRRGATVSLLPASRLVPGDVIILDSGDILSLVAVFWSPLASVLSTTNPGVSGWTVAICFSLVPLIAGQLTLLRRFEQIA